VVRVEPSRGESRAVENALCGSVAATSMRNAGVSVVGTRHCARLCPRWFIVLFFSSFMDNANEVKPSDREVCHKARNVRGASDTKDEGVGAVAELSDPK
jgi:hypothetical protein